MASNRYSLRQFEAFVAVAEQLGFHAAGKQLGLSASAVSQIIAELETLLGFKLFERTTRRVSLSSAGNAFLPSAKSLLRQLRQLQDDAEAINSQIHA
jgi:DNA-binding transcriptional LysR family regulator